MYIFGYDLPLPEILFVVFLVNFILLIFIMTQLRKLGSLIIKEKSEISQLDMDTKLLDKFIEKIEVRLKGKTKEIIDKVKKKTSK